MSDYLLIASRDPFESRDVPQFYGLAVDLARQGDRVALFLVQDGVFAARDSARSAEISAVAAAGVEVLADTFSLNERGVSQVALATGVSPASLDVVVDHLAAGRKAIWN